MTKEQRQIINKAIDTINKKTFCINYHVIRPTIEFQSTDVSFVAYNDIGDMKYFYINFEHGYANCCHVHIPTTNECIECNINISDWFFN